MDRVAILVDAGYLFAQGSALLSGQKLPRSQVILSAEACVRALSEFARNLSGVELLRIYWYDGTSTGPTPQQLILAHLEGVKLRLGFVNSVGEQKGVDSLIITDMITLARNRAISDAVLLSGDEDLRVGVQQAQEFGVRVHLLGTKPAEAASLSRCFKKQIQLTNGRRAWSAPSSRAGAHRRQGKSTQPARKRRPCANKPRPNPAISQRN